MGQRGAGIAPPRHKWGVGWGMGWRIPDGVGHGEGHPSPAPPRCHAYGSIVGKVEVLYINHWIFSNFANINLSSDLKFFHLFIPNKLSTSFYQTIYKS